MSRYEPVIGDTVQILEDRGFGYTSNFKGAIGVVKEIKYEGVEIGVDFSDYVRAPFGRMLRRESIYDELHSLLGTLDQESGRYFSPYELELVRAKEPKFITDDNYKNLFE